MAPDSSSMRRVAYSGMILKMTRLSRGDISLGPENFSLGTSTMRESGSHLSIFQGPVVTGFLWKSLPRRLARSALSKTCFGDGARLACCNIVAVLYAFW